MKLKQMGKYKFNKQVTSELKGFNEYLEGLGYSRKVIVRKSNYAGCFLEWLKNEHLSPEETRYNDMLSFIDYCKSEGDSINLINNKLRSTRDYYSYLKKQGKNVKNPSQGLYVRGTRHKIPANLLSLEELDEIYQSYPPPKPDYSRWPTLEEKWEPRWKRNKAILGLLVYQGITTEEVKRLETRHLKLKEGKIYIPGGHRRNSRTLELKPFQIVELYEYINQVRPEIIKLTDRPGPCQKLDKTNLQIIEQQLFISMNGKGYIQDSLSQLFKEIRKIVQEIQNARQIRASVIVNWLKTNNLRQVQYMAGHKYVSSTERYQLGNLEKLQDRLEKYHPLNTTNQ